MDNEKDEEIINLYKQGNQEAFKHLIDRYTSPIYNFISRIANQNDAPDIIQEVFIKVWKSLDRFDSSKASFKTWLFTIAKNTTTDFLRKKHHLLFSDMNKNDSEETDSFAENIPDDKLLPHQIGQKLQEEKIVKETQ